MKLLLCVNRISDHAPLWDKMAEQSGQQLSPRPDPQSATFIFHTHYMQHEVSVCELGFGGFQTGYKITKALSQQRYHLAVKTALCNAYNPEINIGDIVSVIKDKPGDYSLYPSPKERVLKSIDELGSTNEDSNSVHNVTADLYESGLVDKESFPHYKGAFINMNNSYMNVMMPYKKVVSVTVSQYGDVARYAAKRENYKADIETMDGLGFVYACMYERQPFYQINCVERNLASGVADHDRALLSLNDTLLDILQKL